ncbi:cystatin-2-like isoform X1 [Dermacentor variabilis]|uniref:cystatin-2-like isoform X1 n=1 Tax=Dermacentor variabilis TaxID=34621 RepID=UPI003F5C050B
MWLLACCVVVLPGFVYGASLPGGFYRRRVDADPIYTQMAHFAIAQHTADHEYFDTVLELFQVDVQSAAGFNYRLKFTTAESTCRGEETYSPVTCPPKGKEVKEVCTAFVFFVPWVGSRSLRSINCEPPDRRYYLQSRVTP